MTSGPYRFVRHPLYFAGFVAVTGDSLMTANWYLLGTGAVVLALLVLRTKKQEENLVARFGDDYRGYMRSTGRFFPRLLCR